VKRYRIVLVSAVCAMMLLGALSAAGCGKKSEGGGGATGEPIKIGVVLSASGGNEPLGKAEKAAIELFVEQVNAAGGINGRPLEVIIKDDASDNNQALEKARDLVAEDVPVIIGSSGTGTTLAMKDVTYESKVPQVCMAAGNSITASKAEWIFRTPPTDAMAAERALIYVRDVLKVSKVAILYDNNAFGKDGNDVLSRMAPNYNIEVVANEAYGGNDTEEQMDNHLTNIQSSNPQALIVWGTNPGPAIARKRMVVKGMDIPFIGSHGIANAKFIELAGDAAEGVVLPAGKMLVWQDALEPGSAQYELVKKFSEDYKAKTGSDPNTFAGHGWDAMLIVQDALKRAGNDLSPEAVRNAIEKVSGLVGTAGVFTFSPEDHNGGLSAKDLVMVKIEGGKWKMVK
jgi:branched-chain amino acid transport system substrate-binding protein